MKKLFLAVLLLACTVSICAQQQPPKPLAHGGEVIDRQFSTLEREFVPLVEAMPADKFNFAPTNGEFKGVRTFAEQAKHVAGTNYVIAARLLGEKPPVEVGNGETGPDNVKTKEDVVKFVKDSFVYAHKAIGTLNEKNLVEMIDGAWGGKGSRMAMANMMIWHSFDHYGQMVEYLRMNGIVASGEPPAVIEAIFLDAGNTLVFPDHSLTLAPLKSRGIVVDNRQLLAAERAARHYRDSLPSSELSPNTDHQYWVIYFRELLGPQADPDLVEELITLSRTAHNWTAVLPSTRESLLALKQHHYVGVISNSDGHMADLLNGVGLDGCFDAVTDSTIVGYQKPDPGIFHAALQRAKMKPEQSVYVGDIYSIDYLGATAIGMKAIVMDRFGAYAGLNVSRITSLADLPVLLATL